MKSKSATHAGPRKLGNVASPGLARARVGLPVGEAAAACSAQGQKSEGPLTETDLYRLGSEGRWTTRGGPGRAGLQEEVGSGRVLARRGEQPVAPRD
jgi:hypothetical protein